MKKISITRALVELKLYDKKIMKASTFGFISYTVSGTNKIPDITPKASLQSVKDLIASREHLKNAIQKANSSTKVKIGNNLMTIAQAIDRKHSIHHYENLLSNMRDQYRQIHRIVDKTNAEVDAALDRQLEAINGSSNKTNPKESESYSTMYRDNNQAKIDDPLDLAKAIDELDTFITEFMSEVDLSLSEINSKTEIEISE